MNKVALYVRVSTTSQLEEGYSIEEQKAKLESYCDIKDWHIYKVYTDGGFSGSTTERPALEQLIKDAQSKLFDTVLVYKLDRLSRSQKDTLYLIEDIFLKNNIEFVSLLENFDTSTPFGRAVIGLLSVFAQLEREQIKERMQLGKLGRAKAGKSMMWAKTSYGYNYDKKTGSMTVNEYEALAVKEIYSSYLAGMSITKLRDKINEEYPKQPAWSYRTIRGILANPVYCGLNQYKGQTFQGTHKAIISLVDFEQTQRELAKRQQTAKELSNPRPFQAKYMLSGLAQCGYCHAPLKVILGQKRKDGTRFKRYECYQRHPRKTKGVTVYNDNKKCESGYYDMDLLEHYVLTRIAQLQNDPDKIKELFSDDTSPAVDKQAIQKQIDSLTLKLSKLNDLYLDDRITLDELRAKSSDFIKQRATLEEEIKKAVTDKQAGQRERIEKLLDASSVLDMSYDNQKVIVRELIDKVQVTSDKIVIRWKI
ncbi:recombinase family protein [Streptococcus parasanguinis]|uniref:recombinase family protein n=1 Tax=Streptococcus parasanguinis TaxID=1318 RepID=UPI0012BC9D14|nr:recombinase family protein [Streptococcus parasanguinis]MTR54177.1 recombinase family protein [Streptococcus parasanguinis]MTR56117.1 recombinase family protein [Streptococcus parasanguinis]MTR60749.1 recombinase family protein [Streptococcus parasanguinis]MTR70000.1 recombinase family protein [Streptococcus parasanguinis]MTS02478.1 recombinase family protein [Streptococcus parasanguinis]